MIMLNKRFLFRRSLLAAIYEVYRLQERNTAIVVKNSGSFIQNTVVFYSSDFTRPLCKIVSQISHFYVFYNLHEITIKIIINAML